MGNGAVMCRWRYRTRATAGDAQSVAPAATATRSTGSACYSRSSPRPPASVLYSYCPSSLFYVVMMSLLYCVVSTYRAVEYCTWWYMRLFGFVIVFCPIEQNISYNTKIICLGGLVQWYCYQVRFLYHHFLGWVCYNVSCLL